MKTKILPESWLTKMSPQDRKLLGKAGQTQAEASAKHDRDLEAKLQKEIKLELQRRGIPYSWSSMRRPTTTTPGLPDFVFPLSGKYCFIEAKSPAGTLSDDQEKFIGRAMYHGGIGIVTSDFAEVSRFLNENSNKT